MGKWIPARALTPTDPYVPDFSDGPVVFDFEDGLQGWGTSGTIERANTDVLGGEWAVLGVDRGFSNGSFSSVLLLNIDFTNVSALSLEQFFEGSFDEDARLVVVALDGFFWGLALSSTDPAANPGLMTIDLAEVTGLRQMKLSWVCYSRCDRNNPVPSTGYIDNITLLPVPEPSIAALLLLALAVSWVRRVEKRVHH